MSYGELVDIDVDLLGKLEKVTKQCDDFISRIKSLEKAKESSNLELTNCKEQLRAAKQNYEMLLGKSTLTEKKLLQEIASIKQNTKSCSQAEIDLINKQNLELQAKILALTERIKFVESTPSLSGESLHLEILNLQEII